MNAFFIRTSATVFALSLSAFSSFAQTISEVFNKPETPITWVGVDFSETKYFGDPGTVAPAEMKGLFSKINSLTINEPDKYDITKTFKRSSTVTSNIGVTEAVNEKIDPAQIITPNTSAQSQINQSKIQSMVRRYNFPAGSSGVALTFIMDNLSKPTEQETFWVTFIDMKTKSVLFTEKVTGKAAGFGFRNHWAGGIYSGLKEIKSSYYAQWKKQVTK
jgi:hypothetical protein